MSHRAGTWAVVAMLWTAPVALTAQAAGRAVPLRFGVEFARATPTGEFSAVAGKANGFLGWLALPLSRTSPLGIAAEFSVLTLPRREIIVPLDPLPSDLTVTLRSTLSFLGAGPRIEARIGSLALGAVVMAGFNRVITDLTGLIDLGLGEESAVISNSDYAGALKVGAMAALPLYHGLRGTAIGVAGGADYTFSGRAPFPDQDSFGYDPETDRLILERPEIALNHWRLHAGVSVEF